jgi:parallel beta-helix repeat protein
VNLISVMSSYFRVICGASLLSVAVLAALPAQAESTYNLIFVNPTTGTNSGDGTSAAPVKTIGRALEIAATNTIVVLAPGVYSAETGEQFPIFMKSGVTIQGESKDRGQQILIKGSGFYLSRTFAKQKVTIVGAARSGLRGITLTNPESEGYGLWIESTSPVISDNTFTGSGHDGVSVVGSSAPILRNNYFLQNGANGITIYGNSRPELTENIFENTGFGINVAQTAAPRLTGNRVTQNKAGIVVQGDAQPILRNNIIDHNRQDGLVAIGQARPDLGNRTESGGNNFFANGQMDVNAKATNQTIPFVGNQVATTSGQLDQNALGLTPAKPNDRPNDRLASIRPTPLKLASSITPAITPTITPAPTSLLPELVAPIESNQLPLFNLSDAPRKSKAKPPQLKPIAAEELARDRPVSVSPRNLPKLPTLRISVPSSPALSPLTQPTGNQPTGNQPTGIPINVPPPESGSAPILTSRPPVVNTTIAARGDVLPVPSENIPLGSGGDAPSVWRAGTGSTGSTGPVARAAVKFRVLVNPIDANQTAQLQAVVPGAFSTVVQGRSMMQAGAFGDREKAEQLLNSLQSQGLSAAVESY